MTVSIATVVDLLANPLVGSFFDDGRPAWAWDASGRQIVWANAAGLRFFGAATLADLGNRDFVKGGAAAHLSRIAASGNDRPTMVQLRFYRGFKAANTMIQCQPVMLADGTAAVVGNGLQPLPGGPSDETARLNLACSAAAPGGAALAVVSADGTVRAATPSFPVADLSDEIGALAEGLAEDRSSASKRIVHAGAERDLKLSRLGGGGRLVAALAEAGALIEPAVLADPANARPDGRTTDHGAPPPAALAAATATGAATAASAAAAGDDAATTGTESAPDMAQSPAAPRDETPGTGGAAVASAAEAREEPVLSDDTAPEETITDTTPAVAGGEDETEAAEDHHAAPRIEPGADVSADDTLSKAAAADARVGSGEPDATTATPEDDLASSTEDAATIAPDATGKASDTDDVADRSMPAETAADAPEPGDDGDRTVVPLPSVADRSEAADVAAPPDDGGEPAAPGGFVFEQRNRPDRFVWQMNTDGRFTFVSHEFANAVGPNLANLVDRDWADIAAEYRLDDGGMVAEAIERRDTWSGITIDWPVEGTGLRVPVDLAALPAFGGGRVFEGYRGFGVCRTMDATTDPDAVGLLFVAKNRTAAAGDDDAAAEEPKAEETRTSSPLEGSGTGPAEPARGQANGDTGAPPDDAETKGGTAALGGAIGAGAASLWSRALDQTGETAGSESSGGDRQVPANEPPAPLLSKPERRAFRQIAEALGARLEGDDEQADARGAGASPETSGTPAADDAPAADEMPQEAENVVPLPSAFAAGRPNRIDPTLLDRLPIGVLITRDSRVLYANQPMLDLVDYPSREMLDAAGGLEAIVVGPDDDYAKDTDGFADRFVRLRRKRGDHVAVAARLHAVPWNGGNALMMSFRAVDTGEQIAMPVIMPDTGGGDAEALAAVQRRVRELEAILDTATDGVLVLDPEGTILRANDSAEALFGADREEMIGRALAAFLAPESRRAASDYLDGLSKPGVASLLNDGREVIGVVAQGGLIPLFMTVGRIGEGAAATFCAVLRDITQWKKAEEELTAAKRQAEEASSQKSDFLAKISHEIRTPLNAIIGFSEVMMEQRFGPVGNERYREYLRDIHTSGAHIMSLINDLLDLSKIEAGKLDLSFEAVSAADVIQECVALMQPQANRDRIIIRTSLPSSVPKIVADPRSLRQIVLNLLSNAIKFNNSGGQVIVSAALEDSGEVTIRVRDTGVGMSDTDIETALEPFRQLHTSRYGGGTGLGLPLTKALVEANRASFSLTSEVSQGTLVEISFPTTRVLAE